VAVQALRCASRAAPSTEPGSLESVLLRRILSASVAVGVLSLVSGCNTSSLSKQEMVVHFEPDATPAEHAAVLANCGHVTSETVPEPLETSSLVSNNVGDVRFRTDHANDHDLALLTECIDKQAGVTGVETPDLTN
jgi:hypothetical protein